MSNLSIKRAAGAAAVALTLALPGAALGAPGQADPGFGTRGTVTVALDGAGIRDLVVQPDGKIVAVGYVASSDGGWDVLVTRFLPDGTPDAAFGTPRLDVHTWDDASAVALQPDGRIVVAGSTSLNYDGLVWRLNPDGSTDTSFGSGGSVRLGGVGYEGLADVTLGTDGTIVVGGVSGNGSQGAMVVFRLTAQGSLDPGFSSDGTVVYETAPNRYDDVQAVGVQPDGGVIVAGDDGSGGIGLHRLTRAGVADLTFGSGGVALIPQATSTDADLRVLDDGSIVALGERQLNSADPVLARFSARGVLDPSFGGAVDLGGQEYLSSLDMDATGRFVAGGSVGDDGVVVRFDAAGHLDPTFDDDGVAEMPGPPTYAYAVAVQPDGAVVAAGYDDRYDEHAVLVRFQGDPPVATPPGTAGPTGPTGPTGSGDSTTPTPTCQGKPATIVGTPGKDRLLGSPRRDVIVGLAGDDRVDGRGGDDLVCAGTGGDLVRGGPGRDTLLGQGGQDRLLGGPGKDRLVGGPGRDVRRP